MPRPLDYLLAAAILVACVGLVTGYAVAQEEEDNEDDDRPIVDIDLGEVVSAVGDAVDEIQELSSELDDILIEVGLTILVKPFQLLANTLSDILTSVMVAYPDVTQEDVLDLHWLVYQLTLLLAVPGFIWIGFEHMTGRRDGIRPTAKLGGILVAGGLAPWLLYYPIEISRLVALALQPNNVPIAGGLTVSLATAVFIWVKAIVLLFLVLVFAAKNFYLLYYVVASPVIFLLAMFRPTRGVMQQLTGYFIGFLLIAPMDLIAYQLVLIQLNVTSGSDIPGFIWGIAGLFVLLGIPYVILSSGTSLVLPGMMMAREASSTIGEQVKPVVRERFNRLNNSRAGLGEYRRRAENRFLDNRESVRVEERSGNEVELHPRRTLGNAARRVRDRVADTSPEEVEVEGGEWWDEEAEFTRGDD